MFRVIFLAGMLFSPWVHAVSTFVINFHVKLAETGCTVVGDQNVDIDFGQIDPTLPDSNLYNIFSIVLNCPKSIANVELQFSGEAAGDSNQYIKNTGTASNVAIELRSDPDDTLISNGTEIVHAVNPATSNATFSMKTRVVPLGGIIKTGTLQGTIEYTIVYP